MCGRFGPLSLAAVLLGVLAFGSVAQAHRLDGEYKVRLGEKKVRIECWFDLTGDPPAGAKVKVERVDGSVLTEGMIDEKGFFTFDFTEPEPLRVVVTAGDGHRCELRIPEKAFKPGEEKPAVRGSQVTARDVMSGIGLLLGAAAFVMSLRNARQLHQLREARGGTAP